MIEDKGRKGEMTHSGKGLAAQPDGESISKTHMLEGENQFLQVFL